LAQNATIFKVTLEIADIDRAYYKGRRRGVARTALV
jgi:uncharacterized protein YaeQ